MKASLIIHDLSELNQYHKVLFNRVIYGYTDNSNHNSFPYQKGGIIAKTTFKAIKKGFCNKKKDFWGKRGDIKKIKKKKRGFEKKNQPPKKKTQKNIHLLPKKNL